MKMIVLLLTAAILQVSASTYGQNVTINQRNADLAKVIRELRKQTGFDFVYSNKMLEQAKPVNLNLNNVPFEVALEQCFKNQPLTFSITDKIVTIKEKAPSFLERLAERWASIDVSGRVVDADGRGLPGASVSVKGKGKAVSTGSNGSFYLKGVDEDAILVVSFIGYVPKEIKAAKELGDVVLELSTSKLDEVQVIAYGTTTQRLSTGNVTTIKADVIEKQPVNNPLLALQGRVPGLFIEQATGFAGTGVKVRIQGQNSYLNGSDPLYVIDGVPYTSQLIQGGNSILGSSGTVSVGNPLTYINPSDIESITVLKDADATSIYGSRAANGAILITTKKGKAGDTRVDMNLQSGWSKVPNRLDLLSTGQYLEMRREALRNDGVIELNSGAFGDSDLNGNWDNTTYKDWQNELIGKTAGYQDINVSVSGGSDRTTFLIGSGYHKESNVFPGNFHDTKTSLHFNINHSSANNRFKIQFSGSYLLNNNKLPPIDLTQNAIQLVPVAPSLYTSSGTINWAPDNEGITTYYYNPIGYTYKTFLNKTNNLTSNMVLSYQIFPGLELKTNLGYNVLASEIKNKETLQAVTPEDLQYVSRGTYFGNNQNDSWIIEPQLSYKKDLSGGKLEILLGSNLTHNTGNGSQIFVYGFNNDLVMDDVMSGTAIIPISSMNAVYKYNALFGRINYNWNDKYVLNATGRRDGSSRFGPKSQFHNFASLAGAWIFSNEKIIKDNLSFLSFGKLRGSYGTTGSDQIGDYKTLSLYTATGQGIPYQGIPIYQPAGLSNPYLEWEETRKLQFGLDLGFFSDKFLLNVNYYSNHSSNQLANYTLPQTTGFLGIAKNQAYKIKNSGWELTFATSLHVGEVNWNGSINMSIPKTLLVDYPDIIKSSAASTAIIGKPLTSQLVYHFLGVDPATGIYLFEDRNGNPTRTPKSEDATVLLDLAPKFYGGFQNTISYKGFQLDFMFAFVKQIAPDYSLFGFDNAGVFAAGVGNQIKSILSRWQKPGDIAPIQRFTTSNGDLYQAKELAYQSDAAWRDASYIRLKNLSLSWEIPKKWQSALSFKRGNLFAQGQNLWTITSYNGLDPETKSSITLPPLRVLTIGARIGL